MNHKAIEAKWQKRWGKGHIFKVTEDPKRKKYYVLEMFPYPSGKLHMGHVRNYAIGDAFTRYKRMQGFNVLYPMGYDALGLPAENAAIKNNSNPKDWTERSIGLMKEQQKLLGLSYDWGRLTPTCNPEYYKWNQWFFLKFYEKGLAYKKAAPINWCPKCGTVLANEQVVDGKCWRCKADVEIKNLEQWFLKITKYADELLNDLDKLEDWPERVRIMQRNWIGKSEGTMIHFKLKDTGEILPVFTTRPDTLFGCTFMVFAPEHPKVLEFVKGTEYEEKVKKFIGKVLLEDRFSRAAEDKEKEGMFIGKYAINPVNGEEIPIYIANFVLLEYGTGAIMAVPTHDQRDFEFAKKYKIPMRVVITPEGHTLDEKKMARAYMEDGVLVNSGEFDGWNNREAISAISEWLEKKKLGERTVQYKLRDWLISRQRYWGTPIPIIYCDKCGTVPLPEKELPVVLPEKVKFTGEGNPLASCKEFVNTACPKCGGKAKRETDTMDTFVDSSWYFFRYLSPKSDKAPFEKPAAKYWMPVDQYIGGIEHAIMHLLYARFFTKVLRDLGLHNVDEPFKRLLCQGMVLKDGAKMSKSLGNTVDPGEIIDRYGADTARVFMLFASLPEKELEWSDTGVAGSYKFLVRVYNLVEANLKNISFNKPKKLNARDRYIMAKTHSTIKRVSGQMESFQFSLAITSLMEFVSELGKYEEPNPDVMGKALESAILLLSPFAPHMCEELWEKINKKTLVSQESWPKYDESLMDASLEAGEELVRSTISDISEIIKLVGKKPSKITLFTSPPWKHEVYKGIRGGKEIADFMKEPELKKQGKDLVSYAQNLLKKKHELRPKLMNAGEELSALNEGSKRIGEQFSCKVEIVEALSSKHPKAKTADVAKPGIFVE